MNSTIAGKTYTALGLLLLIAIGAWGWMSMQKSKAVESRIKQEEDLSRVLRQGLMVNDLLGEIAFMEERIGNQELTTATIINYLKKHKLRNTGTAVTRYTRPTYIEEVRKMTLKDEYLSDVISFLQDVERINKNRIKIKSLQLRRNGDDKDRWTATIAISQILPKKV